MIRHRLRWSLLGLAGLLLTVLTASLQAQELTVSYAQGRVEADGSSGWTNVALGQAIPSDTTIRLSGSSCLDLNDSHGVNITINQPGTYALPRLIETARLMDLPGISQLLASIFSTLVSTAPRTTETVLGLRGTNEGAASSQAWVTSDVQPYLDDAITFIHEGRYGDAKDQLLQAQALASGRQADEVEYYRALLSSLTGKTRAAIAEMPVAMPRPGASWAPGYALLEARLEIDTFAFEAAVNELDSHSELLAANAQRAPVYYFLRALAYRGLRDTSAERTNLAEVERVSPGSRLAATSRKLLENL